MMMRSPSNSNSASPARPKAQEQHNSQLCQAMSPVDSALAVASQVVGLTFCRIAQNVEGLVDLKRAT